MAINFDITPLRMVVLYGAQLNSTRATHEIFRDGIFFEYQCMITGMTKYDCKRPHTQAARRLKKTMGVKKAEEQLRFEHAIPLKQSLPLLIEAAKNGDTAFKKALKTLMVGVVVTKKEYDRLNLREYRDTPTHDMRWQSRFELARIKLA